MPLTLLARARDLFHRHWTRKAVTPREAAKVLSQAAADIKTARERMHERLRAERDAGMVCGRLAR